VGIYGALSAYGVVPRLSLVPGTYFDHVVVIVLENNGIGTICGSNPPPCQVSAGTPFLAGLANNYTIASQYTSVYGPPITSLPNYVALIGGSTFSCNSGGCGTGAGTLIASNLVDKLESAGLTWKGYFENQGSATGCYAAYGVPPYNIGHNPFIWFSDIYNSASRCNNLVLANPTSCSVTDCTLISDLNGNSAPNFMWLTPNDCNNMHAATNCTNGCAVAGSACNLAGDNYLRSLVPNILNSLTFKGTRSALFITFDEGTGYCPFNNSSADCVYASFSGGQARKVYSSSAVYSHYSFLRTVESNWNLGTLQPQDAAAAIMSEFLLTTGVNPPSVQFAWNPPTPVSGTVTTFSASVTGGTSPYTYLWTWGDGTPTSSTTSVSAPHTFATAGTYTVSVKVTDSSAIQQSVTATSTLTVVAPTPVLTAAFTISPNTAQVGVSLAFTGTVSGGNAPYTISWSYGDGLTDSGSPVIHAYGAPGTYTVTMTVTDSSTPTQSAAVIHTVTITQPPPPTLVCSMSWSPTVVIVNQPATFTVTSSGGVPPYSYGWNFADGSSSFQGGAQVSHTFTRTGNFNVTVLVGDSASGQCPLLSTVTVQNANGSGGGGGGTIASSPFFYYALIALAGIGGGASITVLARPTGRRR
jgi:PKD repeat protein